MTNVALTTLTKVGRMASHGVTLGVTKGVKKGVKLKLIASLHLVITGDQSQVLVTFGAQLEVPATPPSPKRGKKKD